MAHPRRTGFTAGAIFVALVALAGAMSQDAEARAWGGADGTLPMDTLTISGVVMDRAEGGYLEGVSIRLTGPEGEESTALTDAQGDFSFGPLPPGDYLLEAEYLGYESVETTVHPTGEDDLEIVLGLVPEPVELEPIVAARGPQIATDLRDFHERKVRGHGQYLSPEDIQRLDPARATEALEELPALQAETGGGRAGTAPILFRGQCAPEVFVDGIRSDAGAHEVNEMVSAADLYGVEVHGPSTVPLELTPRRPCGVVAIWTQPASEGGGDPSFERSVVAVTVLGLVLTLF